MPASLPGDTAANNAGNPNAGVFVMMDPLSGPKGTPLAGASGNLSTGGLSTGIGYGANHIIGPTAPASILAAGFDDDQIPGTVHVQGFLGQAKNVIDSRMMYIGGGRMVVNPDPVAKVSVPWIPSRFTAGVALVGAGNGASRDSGSNTGFATKMVTAAGAVAGGAVVETGFVNRSGVAMVTGQSAYGSAAAGQAVPTEMEAQTAPEGESHDQVDFPGMGLVAADEEPVESWWETQHGMTADEFEEFRMGGTPVGKPPTPQEEPPGEQPVPEQYDPPVDPEPLEPH